MNWAPRLTRGEPPERRRWASNQEILDEYVEHLRRNNYSRNVLLHRPADIRVFIRMWGDTLVTTLEEQDIQLFVDTVAAKCPKLQGGEKPMCWLRHDVTLCPLMRIQRGEDVPLASCPDYRPLDPAGTWSYICNVKALYRWLLTEGYIKHNSAEPVQQRFSRRHKALFIKRARKPRRRIVVAGEVRKIVLGSPIQRAIIYAFMAKCFLRLHEVLKLSLEPRHCSLEEGWLEVPPNWMYGDKRIGNPRIILDAEMRDLLRRYLAWRERKVKRGPDGTPVTSLLILTQFGLPWSPKGFAGNLRQALHRDCRRLGIMTGKETTREERFNPHCFRAFASTWARDKRATDAELEVLRGDKAPGAIERYDHYIPRLPELYRQFAPHLELSAAA